MSPGRLSFDERKQVLKWYWKFENIAEVQREWKRHFGTSPPTRITIARLREKFDNDGTVQDVCQKYSGRPPTGGLPSNHSTMLSPSNTSEKNISVSSVEKMSCTTPDKPQSSPEEHKETSSVSDEKQSCVSNEKQAFVSTEKSCILGNKLPYVSTEKSCVSINKVPYVSTEKPIFIPNDKPVYTLVEKTYAQNEKMVYNHQNNKVVYTNTPNEKPMQFTTEKVTFHPNDKYPLAQQYRQMSAPHYKPISAPQYKPQQYVYDNALARENLVQQILRASK